MLNDSDAYTSTVFLWEFRNRDVSPNRNWLPIFKIQMHINHFLFKYKVHREDV